MISERAADIFLEANSLDPETRAQFVTSSCGGDPNLLNEVNSLLEAANESEEYFDGLVGKVSLGALAGDEAALPKDKIIGQWRLRESIGRGGMGAVYLAERADEQFEQRAALKILPTGLDTDQARARFLIERQILARLVHDNIARLLDGGVTEEGVPYFVMDFVEGLPVDGYCDQHQLNTGQRLKLILDIAKAVQFAHRNLIIHRDLKPSNVLVTNNGQVRLLDFGIAKMLEPNVETDDLTRITQRPATPAFASPEMLRGDPVDVTTDVYSIGVLIYVLLTGRAPLRYDGMTLAEMCDHATTTVPPLMSSENPKLQGDLDAIVARALAKEPVERYESVESLANDVHNFLSGLPVTAKVPSPWYRARKFIGRHRLGVTFAGFATIALTSIAALAVKSAITSERQAREIALERDRAEETTDFLISIFDSADPNIEPADQTALQILEKGRERIENELSNQPEVQVALLEAMGLAYQSWRLATEAREVFERERQIRSQLNGAESSEYADVLIRLAQISDIAGDYEASLDFAQQALAVSQGLQDLAGQAAGHTRVGRILHLQGDYEGAGSGYRQALALYSREYGPDSLQVSQSRSHLANLLNHQTRYEEAIAEFEEALRVRRLFYDGDHSEFTEILLGMGSTLKNLGRLDEATETYETALDMNTRLYGPDNSYNLYVVNGLGLIELDRGRYELAISRFEDSVRLIKLHTPDSPNLAFALANIGKAYALRERYDLAIPAYRQSADVFQSRLPEHWVLGDVKWRLGRCLLMIGEFKEAETLIVSGLETVEDQWGADHKRTTDARAAALLLYETLDRPGKAAEYKPQK
ncbi:MAG: tetratricopeptide repeat protein [Woeseiaceae bacterium]